MAICRVVLLTATASGRRFPNLAKTWAGWVVAAPGSYPLGPRSRPVSRMLVSMNSSHSDGIDLFRAEVMTCQT